MSLEVLVSDSPVAPEPALGARHFVIHYRNCDILNIFCRKFFYGLLVW
jgi:hypothetical protein